MCDVERIVDIDVTIDVVGQILEDVLLQGVGRFHNEGIQVKPPEPRVDEP